MYLVLHKNDYENALKKTHKYIENDMGVYHTLEEAFNCTSLEFALSDRVFIELGEPKVIKQTTPVLVKYVPKKVSKQ